MEIDANSHIPIYEQIVGSIRAGIAAGIYRPGEMLPSLRKMALDLLVNPNTVQRAYEALEREGLVYSRRGLGLFVAKGGVASAREGSEQTVAAALRNGVRSAQAAGLDNREIRRIFEDVLEDAHRPLGRKK